MGGAVSMVVFADFYDLALVGWVLDVELAGEEDGVEFWPSPELARSCSEESLLTASERILRCIVV